MKKAVDTRLIGIALPEKTSNENGQSNIDCGQLWQKFEAGSYFAKIPGKTGNSVYAVYHEYDGDYTAPFSYFIGCPVEAGVEVPADLSEMTLPAGEYEKVVARGPHARLHWQSLAGDMEL